MAELTVAFDMTFADRNRGGSGGYARSLVKALRARNDVSVREIHGPGRGLARTLRWLLSTAAARVGEDPPRLVHCPSVVAPWRLPVPFVVTIPDTLARRFPRDHPAEWLFYERVLLPARAR